MTHRQPGVNAHAQPTRRLLNRRPAHSLQNAPANSPRHLFAILLALVVCGLAFWLRLAIDDVLPPGFPFLTFFPAILLSTYMLGLWPGIACSIFGGLLSVYYFIPPDNGWEMSSSAWVAIGFYAFISAAFVLMLTTMDYSLRKADFAQRHAEANSEFQSVMAKEMNHRVKNLFGVVTSIVRLTAKSNTDTATFATQLAGRISSLSHAHELVWEAAGQTSVSIHEVVERILAPHQSQLAAASHISISGDCRLDDPHILQVLSLLIHELATNAAKYGALSNDHGQLQISFEIVPASDGTVRKLIFHWQERFLSSEIFFGATTDGTGFGTELMKRLVAGVDGIYHHEVKPGEGIDAYIELPLEQHLHQD